MKRLLSMALCIAMIFSMLPAVSSAAEAPQKSLADYPDLLFGVGTSTSAGPSLPGGSVHPSPETRNKDNGGYSRNQDIMGFGQIYAQGTGGTQSYGNFFLTPQVDTLKLNHGDKGSRAVNGTEIAKCYEYSVELANGIRAKVTPSHNAAIYAFEYPAGKDASFVLDVARKMNGSLKNGSVTVDLATKTISGGGTFDGNWNPAQWDMYFALEFDADFVEMGTFTGTTTVRQEKATAEATDTKQFGAYVKFTQTPTTPLEEAATVEDKAPAADETPAIPEEAPVEDEPSAASKETQAVEEIPVVEETPVVEEEPRKEIPVAEELSEAAVPLAEEPGQVPSTQPLTVKIKIAVSFVSEAQAKAFLDDQIPAFDYDAVKDAAKAVWEEKLEAIEIETDDEALLRQFYTALYHTNVHPRDRVNDHGNWDDFYTIWDSWKTAMPLKTFFYPQQVGEIVASFIDRAEANDVIIMSDAYIQGKEFVCGQGGNDIENIIADACLKDIPLPEGYTWERAYDAVVKSAESMRTQEYVDKGFVSTATNKKTVTGASYSSRLRPGSATQGFAVNDFAVAQMAQKLGKTEDYEFYLARSKSWKNAWNPTVESEGFYGFPQNPASDGTFASGYNPHGGENSHFYEATGWDSSFTNRHDIEGLIEAQGGRQEFIRRLKWACDHSVNYSNDNWSEGYLNFTNEPSMHIPWLFCMDEIQRPDLASHTVNRILTEKFLKPNVNDYPGDEDGGAMSSYFIFMMSGFFPYSTTNDYYLHGTRLPRITFRLGNGESFVITGENTGGDNIYVQSATWQGQPLNECKLTYEQLMEGGELNFVMGDTPSKWARMEDNEPPTNVTGLAYDEDSAAVGKAVLTWDTAVDEGEGLARYDIYRSDKIVFDCDESTFLASVSDTSFAEVPEITTRYWYRVVAVDGADNVSTIPAQVCVNLGYDDQEPDKVVGIAVENSLLGKGIVKLSWATGQDNVGVSAYRVYRGTTASFAISADTLLTTVDTPSFTDMVPAVGTYYYRVTAQDAYGNVSPVSDSFGAVVTGELPEDVVATPGVNLAKGKPAKVNGQTNAEKEGGDKAVDGLNTSKWCVKSTGSNGGSGEVAAGTPLQKPHWLELDLGKETVLNRWVVTHASNGSPVENALYNTREFKLQWWDGVEWKDADVVTENTAGITDRTFPTVLTSKVRLEITRAVQDVIEVAGVNKVQTARIYELELYAPSLESPYKGSLTMGPDVVYGANGKVNSAEGPEFACDGNTATQWSVRVVNERNEVGGPDMGVVTPDGIGVFENGSSWMTVDLGEVCRVDRMLYQGSVENAAHRTQAMYLQTSVDSESWVYSAEGVWKDGTDQVVPASNRVEHTFDQPITARYFRLLLPALVKDDQNYNARVKELHLFGEKVSSANKITVGSVDGANVIPSLDKAEPGDQVTIDVEYTRADREFVKLLVTGVSGTPVPVTRYGAMLVFQFTMPNEPVEIRLYSKVVIDADREALQAALYALKGGTITVDADADEAALIRSVRAYVARLLAETPGATGVVATIETGTAFGAFKITLEKGGVEVVKEIDMVLSGYHYKIDSVAEVPAVTVSYGTPMERVTLPENVTVTFREGVERSVGVTWACPEYNKDDAGRYTFVGTLAAGGDYTNPQELTALCYVTVSYPLSGSGSSNTTTKTEQNPDGSTTKTVTNKKTGEVTETTTYPDGTKIVAVTPKDGEATIEVTVPKGKDSVTVTIPTKEQLKNGEVAVIIHEDGTREVVKTSVSTEDGLRVTLSANCKLEIVDNSKTFADVPADHWSADAITFVTSRELFNGGDGGFQPTGDMSRAMLFTVLARLDGQDLTGGATWYENAMRWAKESGVSDGANPEASITRESLAVMLYRYAGSPEVGGMALGEFADAESVSSWASDAMFWCVDSGILNGNGGKLNPSATATRAEVAMMLQRFISL